MIIALPIGALVEPLQSPVGLVSPNSTERITNGQFTGDPSSDWIYLGGWTASGTDMASTSNPSTLLQEIDSIASGSVYSLSFDITDAGAGPDVTIVTRNAIGTVVIDTLYSAAATVGTKTASGTTTGVAAQLFISIAGSGVTIDNVSLVV